jgi:hypothetical protein
MGSMTKQEVRGLAVVLGILLGAAGAAQARAEETGIAQIHSWVKMGRKTCMVDHFHSGTGNGDTRGQAERKAVQSWVDFTAWEYGNRWGRYSIAASKKMTCERTGSWTCFVEARPCRPF